MSLSRPAIGSSFTDGTTAWPMPDFTYWTFPQSHIGSVDNALARIAKIEDKTPWEKKISKAVWRGTAMLSPYGNKNLREKLLRVAEGQIWADIEEVKKKGPSATKEDGSNVLTIEDFCRYKYVIYTEVCSILFVQQ